MLNDTLGLLSLATGMLDFLRHGSSVQSCFAALEVDAIYVVQIGSARRNGDTRGRVRG